MAEATERKGLEMRKDYEAGAVSFSVGGGEPIEVRLSELPADIQRKLAVYGLAVKLSRATAGKPKEQWLEILQRMADRLRQGEWTTGVFGSPKKQAVLNLIRETDPSIREQFIASLRTAGILERTGVTDEDIKAVIGG